ncbi:MAG TPA: MoaD/ThiS family protein [Candidatus Methylomirabilis sp.]|jgi:molybdopterin converting factor small subunit
MVRLKLMPPLTRIVGEREVTVDVGRALLKAVIERAAAGNGRFRAAMLDAGGNLSGEYSCLVNGRRYNVSDLDGIEVDEADEIVILMPIAGGGAVGIDVLVTTHVMGLDRDREDAWPLPLPPGAIRLRDLIRAKVTREVADYGTGRRRMVGKEYLTLDELAAFQAAAARGAGMRLEAEEEVRRAVKAFEEGDYIVTVDGREVHDLDALVAPAPGARVQFLRLLPVAGGLSPRTAGEQGAAGAEGPRRRSA